MAGRSDAGDLAYALKLLASGRAFDEVWKEAGFGSRKALAEEIFRLSERVSSKPKSLVAYSDGASIGNPGEAGCGAVLLDPSGRTLAEEYRYLGRTTNNVAEYKGAILALEQARTLGATQVELRVDSELLANQINGGYKVKSRQLAGLYENLMKLVKHFDKFEVTRIKRADNRQADRLANLAISARRGGDPEAG